MFHDCGNGFVQEEFRVNTETASSPSPDLKNRQRIHRLPAEGQVDVWLKLGLDPQTRRWIERDNAAALLQRT